MTSKLPVELIAGSGTSGQVLTSNGTGSSPSFQDATAPTSTEYFMLDVGDETTDLTTGTAKKTFRVPLNLELTDIRASVNTAPVGSDIIVDVNKGGTTLMNTNKLTIDAGETTTETAATGPVLTTTKLSNDSEITVDIDQIGSTTAGKGLKLVLIGQQYTPTGLIDEALASTCGELDATLSTSYSGTGQTWSSVTVSPADGNAQTAYDMFLGETGTATSDDPTFTGSAGDSGAYFLLDGVDHFNMQTNTTLLNELQADNGQDWWLAIAFRFAGIAANPIILSTGGLPGEQGIEVFIGSVGNGPSIRTRLNHNRNTTRTVNNFNTAGYYVDGSDYLLVISFDSANDQIRVWKNGTGETSGDINSNTGTANSTFNYKISKRGSGSNHMANGSRIYHQSFGNSFLTDGDEATIRSILETRHGRTYNAP